MPTKHPEQPLVSVILIFFNEERFIAEAVESVLAQTYPHWELLLVNDGSRDRSPQIAQTYAQDQRIRYLTHPNQENRGMSATRNLGLQQAKGDYITFLDGDDILLPRKLSEQVQILRSHPEVALVCGRTQWWHSWNPQTADRDFQPALHLPLNAAIPSPHILMQFLKDEWASLHDLTIRREAVQSVGGYENQFRGMYEDQAFHAKLCLRYTAWIADSCGYRYRQHSASCCNKTDNAGWLAARQTYLEWLEHYLMQPSQSALKPPVKRPVAQLVQRELWRYRAPLLFYVRTKLQRLKSARPPLSKIRNAPPAQRPTPAQQETPC